MLSHPEELSLPTTHHVPPLTLNACSGDYQCQFGIILGYQDHSSSLPLARPAMRLGSTTKALAERTLSSTTGSHSTKNGIKRCTDRGAGSDISTIKH